MWIVKNELKGRVRFPGLGIEIPPEGEFDLDTVGRERVEASGQVRVTLDQHYLRTVRKTVTMEESELEKMIESRVATIKEKLVKEINALYSNGRHAPVSDRGI